jgi:WD40 repeat protein
MGGGTSKDDGEKKGSAATQQTTRSDNASTTAAVAANTSNAADNAPQAAGLQCTVVDSVSNAKVAFLSSVSNAGSRAAANRNKKARGSAAAGGDVSGSPDGEDGAEGHPVVVRLGDALIITGRDISTRSNASGGVGSPTFGSDDTLSPHNGGSVEKYNQMTATDRGDWRGAMSIVHAAMGPIGYARASSPALGTVHVGGAVLQGAPQLAYTTIGAAVGAVGMVTPSSLPLSGNATPQPPVNSDVSGKYTLQQKAAVFTSKTRYAAPLNFSMKSCGGQSSAVRAIAASADGTLFASVFAGSKSAQYFDGNTGNLIMEIRAHLDPIVAVGHSRDGKFLLTSSADGNVCLWDLNNGKKLREIPVTSQANAIAISDDSDMIATSSTEDFVNLWESKNGEALTMFQRHSGAVYCVAFSRRGGLVASGSQNGEVFVWGAQAGDVRLHIETGARTSVMNVSFSQDSTRLITSDRDVMQVWDLFTGGLVFTRNGTGEITLGEEGKTMHQPTFMTAPKEIPRITCVLFAACNNIVCGLTTKKILVLEPNSGCELLSLDVKALVTCMSTNWSGDVIFVGDYSGNHYRISLAYAHRDVIDFGLNTKPPAKERGKADRD